MNGRLIPTDHTGIKAAVLHVSNAEHAVQVLQRAGIAAQSFPGYLAVPVPSLSPSLSRARARSDRKSVV